MLAIDLAICVAGGRPWLGASSEQSQAGYACREGAVLWIDVDNGRDRIESRLAAIAAGHEVSPGAPLQYVSFPEPPIDASDPKTIDALVKKAKAVSARLVVVDTLGAVSGGADENTCQMMPVMSGLRRVAEETGAAVLVTHHRTKNETERAGNSLRGHSSIEGAVDLAILVERERDADQVVLQPAKSRDAPLEPIRAQWNYENEGAELRRGWFVGLGEQQVHASQVDKAETAILMAYEPGLNQSAYVEKLKARNIGRASVLAALKRLVGRGELVTRRVQRDNQKKYYKPEDLPD